MATEDERYRQSSQFRLWSFSISKLASMREQTNARARASIAERLTSHPPPAATSAPTSNANTPDAEGSGSGGVPALPEFLTHTEEALFVTFYTSELLRAAEHAEMSDEIKATAAAFFRRFYVTNSIMTYPPQDMLLVALFFACKAEGWFVPISEFAKIFGRERPDEILAGEFLLCQGIRFAFDVKHPFRALRGAVMELRLLEDLDKSRIEIAEKRARDILRFSPLITDAYFHYTPSQIMLAALSLADRGLAERFVQKTFHFVEAPGANANTPNGGGGDNPAQTKREQKAAEDRAAIIGAHIRDKVLGTVESCRDMLARELPERREHWTSKTFLKSHIQPMRKKLNKCRDPERWNLVEMQRARREQGLRRGDSEDGEPEDRDMSSMDTDGAVFGGPIRETKRRKVAGKGLDDPFGPPL